MAKLPVGSLVLAVLRTIADEDQKDVEAKAGYAAKSVNYYERRKEPPPEVLSDFVSSMEYPAYMIGRTWTFVEEALASREPEKALSPEEILRLELEERAWAGFRDLQGRLDEIAEAWLEHREAPYLWRRLERHTAEARLALVRKGRDFWSPGLCALVCEKSVAAAVYDGREAEDLAHLAIEIARQVPGREARRARLEGFAQAVLGNALRVRSQLPLADAAFVRSATLWSQGAGTFHELLDPSRPLDLEASLRLSQRKLHQAFELLDRALPLARSSRARGRILLLRAKVLEEKGEHGEALACLDQAEPHIVEAGDPFFIFGLTVNRLVNLCDLGRAGEAAHGLEEVKGLANCVQSSPQRARCRWLEARVAAALGQREVAIAAFREVLEVFVASESPYDCALIHLDLATVLLREGRNGEVLALVAQMEPIFVAQGVHREALAALQLFVDAARQEQASVELAQSVLDFLRRSRYNAEVHFEVGAAPPFPQNSAHCRERGL